MAAKFVIDGSRVHMALNTRLQWETLCGKSAQAMPDGANLELELCDSCITNYDVIQDRMNSRLAQQIDSIAEATKPGFNWRESLNAFRTFLYGS